MFKAAHFLPSKNPAETKQPPDFCIGQKWQLEYTHVHSSIILNSQKVEATQVSTNG